MLKLLKKPQHQSFAEKAAKETAPANGVGKFLGTSTEDKESTNYRFESKLTGYVGWEWNVVVFQAKKSDAATVSEVVLLPGKELFAKKQCKSFEEASDSVIDALITQVKKHKSKLAS